MKPGNRKETDSTKAESKETDDSVFIKNLVGDLKSISENPFKSQEPEEKLLDP